jgi:hypothetical protein
MPKYDGENLFTRTVVQVEQLAKNSDQQAEDMYGKNGLVVRMSLAESRLDRNDKERDSNKANYALALSLLVAVVEIWKLVTGK